MSVYCCWCLHQPRPSPNNILFLQHLGLFMLTSKSAMKSVSDITHNNRNRHLVTQTLFIISLNIDFTTASLYFLAPSMCERPNLVSACILHSLTAVLAGLTAVFGCLSVISLSHDSSPRLSAASSAGGFAAYFAEFPFESRAHGIMLHSDHSPTFPLTTPPPLLPVPDTSTPRIRAGLLLQMLMA